MILQVYTGPNDLEESIDAEQNIPVKKYNVPLSAKPTKFKLKFTITNEGVLTSTLRTEGPDEKVVTEEILLGTSGFEATAEEKQILSADFAAQEAMHKIEQEKNKAIVTT